MRAHKYPIVLLIIGIIVAIVVTVAAIVSLFRAASHTNEDPPAAAAITTRRVATGFTQPTDIVSTPGDERLYIVEQTGRIQRVAPEQSDTQGFLDISSKVTNDGEMGLLGLVFHPNYAENGYIYINYIDKNQDTVVARYHVANDAVELASEKVILQVEQPFTNHKGGDLAFGQDGYLYIALGDGGQAGDPQNNAQNKNSLLGKILRVDVNIEQAYTIPTTNPFVGQENVRPEIWAYGLRNPWKFSFDSQTHNLYIADVGQGEIEEIDFQPAASKGGENYGWRCYEGAQEYNLENCTGVNNAVPPIIEYSHEEGRCSVTGGYVYRGEDYPSLQGKYFYGDFCGSQLYYAEKDGDTWKQTLALQTEFAISTFGIDRENELYFADYDAGDIYRIELQEK